MIADERTRQRLASSTRFGDITELASVDSTNRYLLDQARAGAAEGVVVVSDHQTAGRGRLGRSWEDRPGDSLLLSVLLRPGGLAADRRHLAAAAVALAAGDACGSVAGVDPAIKWPNDLVVDDRKLAGVLAVADADTDALVVGIGINVGWAPPGAIALVEAAPIVERTDLLAGLLEALEGWYGRWNEVAGAYRQRCHTLGRRVRIEMPGRVVTGWAQSLDDQGRLQVLADGGDDGGGEIVTLSAADVIHLRPTIR